MESDDEDCDRSESNATFLEARMIVRQMSCVLVRRNWNLGDACKEGFASDEDNGLKGAAGRRRFRRRRRASRCVELVIAECEFNMREVLRSKASSVAVTSRSRDRRSLVMVNDLPTDGLQSKLFLSNDAQVELPSQDWERGCHQS
jgi:hypothetical protein